MKGLQKFAALCTSVVLGACGMGSVLAQPLTADAATESTVPEGFVYVLSLIHISEPTRHSIVSRMPSSA